MKDKYLQDLNRRLEEYDLSKAEIDDILSDYNEMIDDAQLKNMTEEEIFNLIGTPRKVVQDLRDQFLRSEEIYADGHEYQHNKRHDNKIVALMPFISVILFFILGFGWNLWNPGWLVFLLIPLTAIIVNAFDKNFMSGLVALSPFIATITYLIVGFTYNLWHPTWLIFLIIPVFGVLTGAKRMRILELFTSLSPFLAVTTFILIWYYTGVWNPTWLVFLAIPVIGILNERVLWKLFAMEGSLLLAIGGYLYMGYQLGIWDVSALIFLIPLGVSLIVSNEKPWNIDRDHIYILIFVLATLIIYIAFGLWLDTWAYLWMIFLLIPVMAILKESKGKDHLVAIMPFIATVIFFSLGYFFDWWQFSWIAFLLIPITAILKNA